MGFTKAPLNHSSKFLSCPPRLSGGFEMRFTGGFEERLCGGFAMRTSGGFHANTHVAVAALMAARFLM